MPDASDHDVKSALPRIQITGSGSTRAQDVAQVTTKWVQERTIDVAGLLVAFPHLIDMIEELGGVIHRVNHFV